MKLKMKPEIQVSALLLGACIPAPSLQRPAYYAVYMVSRQKKRLRRGVGEIFYYYY